MSTNRYIVIGLGVVIIIGVAVLIFLRPQKSAPSAVEGGSFGTAPSFVPPSTYTATTVPKQMQSAQSVVDAFNSALPQPNSDNVKPQATAMVGDWALQEWSGTYSSGQALMHYDAAQGKWVMISSGGGVWNVADLVKLGVSKTDTLILFSKLYSSH